MVLRGKLVAIQVYTKKQGKLKQSNLKPKGARKKEQTKPRTSTRKEIIKIKAEINNMETKKQ